MTGWLVDVLFRVIGLLLPPVLVALALLSAAMLWTLGGLAREAVDRGRARRRWRAFLQNLEVGRSDLVEFLTLSLADYPSRFQKILREVDPGGPGARKGLENLEIDMARRLSWLTFATRVGPMIGLVGTLLPLGPALRGLASDDLETLAANLETAFATTVFGLLIGGLAYAASVLRRNWYDQDLSDLEYLLEASRRPGTNQPQTAAEQEPETEPAHA
jgi:biopolymer transport protein ExbB/TolQ